MKQLTKGTDVPHQRNQHKLNKMESDKTKKKQRKKGEEEREEDLQQEVEVVFFDCEVLCDSCPKHRRVTSYNEKIAWLEGSNSALLIIKTSPASIRPTDVLRPATLLYVIPVVHAKMLPSQ